MQGRAGEVRPIGIEASKGLVDCRGLREFGHSQRMWCCCCCCCDFHRPAVSVGGASRYGREWTSSTLRKGKKLNPTQ